LPPDRIPTTIFPLTLLAGKINVKGKIVVGILSGGNVDADMFNRLIAA